MTFNDEGRTVRTVHCINKDGNRTFCGALGFTKVWPKGHFWVSINTWLSKDKLQRDLRLTYFLKNNACQDCAHAVAKGNSRDGWPYYRDS